MRHVIALSLPVLLSSVLPAQEQSGDLTARGREAAQQQQWAEAIDTLTKALAAHPDDIEALRWRGHAYTGAQQYEKAFADLERALDLGAEDAWTNYAHAMALYHLGHSEEAVRGYTTALAIDPGFVKAYEWRGFNKSLLGDHIGAVADLDIAIRLDPGNAWLYFIRAKACVALLDFHRAELDLWKVVDGDSENADAHSQLGYLKACLGEVQPAINMLERAVKLDAKGQVEARLWLWQLYADRGDTDAAAAQLQAVQAAAGAEGADAAVVRWPLRLVAFARGEIDLAQLLQFAASEAPKAEEQQARRCAALLHAGLIAARAGEVDRALVLLARAVGTDATDQWEWSLARLRLRQLSGDVEKPR